jgi:hypothetical protein
VLGKKPTSDVTIRLTSSDTTAATVTPLLTFTRRNWSRPQMVTVTGVNDNDAGLLQLRRVKVSNGVTVAAVVSLLVNLMVTSLVGFLPSTMV